MKNKTVKYISLDDGLYSTGISIYSLIHEDKDSFEPTPESIFLRRNDNYQYLLQKFDIDQPITEGQKNIREILETAYNIKKIQT